MTRSGLSLLLILTACLLVLAWPRHDVHAHRLSYASPVHAADKGRRAGRLRVQTDLARTIDSWQGRRDCQSSGRARAALRPVLARWLGGRVTDRPSLRLVRWGYHSGDVWHEDRIIEGQARCIAGFRKVIAFADFD
ncbi:hypothetical protein [Blastomonas sp. AAP53]|uniref:hypothetical protein n=1 Tax=Blastomonas sp. AAP53 TaxID=1248760 RepID=UPI001266EA52|nr:hypothetical protein [Blastomonas sp. AAP53]